MPNYIKLGNLRIEIPEANNNGGGGGGGGGGGLLSGLLAFYNLSDLTDASGNNRTLTNNGGVTFSAGKIGDAAVFDGSNFLDVNGNLWTQEDVTYSAWVNVSSRGLYVIHGNSANRPFFLYNNGEQLQVCFDPANAGNGAGENNNTTNVPLNQWAFVAGRWSNSTKDWCVWVNDQKVTINKPSASASSITNTRATIGCNLSDGSSIDLHFNGSIDAVGLWSRALTDAEVTELYNAGTGKEHPFA